MTKERKEELVRELVAFASKKENKSFSTPQKVLQEITNDISEIISPCPGVLMPFYIAAMEFMAQNLRAHFPMEDELANDLKDRLTCCGVVIPNSKNK